MLLEHRPNSAALWPPASRKSVTAKRDPLGFNNNEGGGRPNPCSPLRQQRLCAQSRINPCTRLLRSMIAP
jgi:hypothetical protein